jgi:2-methylisocitrate lyase-like PEP mutase family enzyme
MSMSPGQSEKAIGFRALHELPEPFVIPNPWDAASARMLASLGFKALATSSAAAAWVLGRRDGAITREEALANAKLIVEATTLPVSADLENGYADDPATVAETICMAAEIGLAGGSIEDSTRQDTHSIYNMTHAAERVAAAAEAARALPFPFVLTARAENFVRGRKDLDDTIRRLQAYEKAGADVLFAPGLPDIRAIRAVCAAISKPVNVMAAVAGPGFSIRELSEAGVRRISTGGALYRAALNGAFEACREIQQSGTFGFANRVLSSAQMAGFLR